MIGSKQIKRMICIACNDTIGDHSFNKLGKCLIRIQGSLILDKREKGRKSKTSTEDGIDALDKTGMMPPKSDSNEDVMIKNNIITSDGDLGF